MDLRGIVLLSGSHRAGVTGAESRMAGIPIPLLDVLGLSVLERMLDRFPKFGVSEVVVIADVPPQAAELVRSITSKPWVEFVEAREARFWSAAEDAFGAHADNGAELVVVARIGEYAEVDFESMVQFHLDKNARVTQVLDGTGRGFDYFVVSASRRKDAAALFQSGLRQPRSEPAWYTFHGYVNPLRDWGDLRRLAVDGLLQKNAIHPIGREVKPGIWVGKGARIHPRSRVLAPAYIGPHARVHAAALITRTTVIEHHAEIDCGTVVENSTVLPHTYIGAGLDVMHSVVGFRHISHLVRKVEVEISDPKLVGVSSSKSILRAAGSVAAVFAFLPKQIYRGFFASSQRESPAELPGSLEQLESAADGPAKPEASGSGQEASQFPSQLSGREEIWRTVVDQ